MINRKDNILTDEVLMGINGGMSAETQETSDDRYFKRAKCDCGEVFMADTRNPSIICPGCGEDIKSKLLASGGKKSSLVASAGTTKTGITGKAARIS